MAASAPELAASEAVTAAPVTQAVAAVGPMPSLIDSLTGGVPLGETEVGKSWCLKALHPADTNVISSPMPTNETRAIASVGFNQMDLFQIHPSFDVNKTWDLYVFVHRDPVLLYSFAKIQQGSAPVTGFIFSKQIAQAGSYQDAYQALRTNCERFRLTSHSLTGYFDGASLSDQGHIVLGQTELPRLNAANWPQLSASNDAGIIMPYTFYQDPPPTYELLLQTTRAYQGHAKDGFYVPSKMQNLGRWVYTNQSWLMAGSAVAGGSGVSPVPWVQFSQNREIGDQSFNDFLGTFPFTRLAVGDPAPFVFAQTDPSLTTVMYTGLSATSSVRLTMRWTMDMIVRPGTVYAPFTRMPPPEDPASLKMYAEVSRRMDDGYPSRYNNLAALLPVIGKIATMIAPTVLPRVGNWVREKLVARRAGQLGPSALELIATPGLTEAEQLRYAELDAKKRAGTITPEENLEGEGLHERLWRHAQGGTAIDVPSAAGSIFEAISKTSAPRRSTTFRRRIFPSTRFRTSYRRSYRRPSYRRSRYSRYGGYSRRYRSGYSRRRY